MYKILPKPDLTRLIDEWRVDATVYGPVRQGDVVGLPTRATLPSLSFSLSLRRCSAWPDRAWRQSRPHRPIGLFSVSGRAMRGLASCWIASLRGQRTQTRTGRRSVARRQSLRWVARILARRAFARLWSLLSGLKDASRQQVDAASEAQAKALAAMERPFELDGIRETLYGLFDDDFWYDVQQPCLGCGVCTFLCPTCHCFDIVDEAQRRERVRNWDTCMFRMYSQEASGHNPRPTNVERTRQRIMHKYAYFTELYDEVGCTGCGRCVRYCPVGIDIRQIIRSSQLRG
jgi:ferredoxin